MIVNIDDKGKIHIWTGSHPDSHGGHYQSVCGREFGIDWTLDNFRYMADGFCKICERVIE